MSLDAWRALGTNAAHVVACFGDSTTEGDSTSGPLCWPRQLADRMRARWGTGGPGFQGLWLQEWWSFSGSPTDALSSDVWDSGPYNNNVLNDITKRLNTSSDIATYTVRGGPVSSLILYMVDGPSSANFSVSIDGGSFANVSGTWTQNNAVRKVTVSGPIATSLRVRGANAAGTSVLTYIIGAEPTYGTTGAMIHNLGSASEFSALCVRSGSGDWGRWLDLNQPAIATWMWTNDVVSSWTPDHYQTRTETFVDRVRANGGEAIIMSFGEQSGRSTTDQAELRNRNSIVATAKSCPYLNFFADWGDYATANAAGYMTGPIHPSVKGCGYIAAKVWGLLGETIATGCFWSP